MEPQNQFKKNKYSRQYKTRKWRKIKGLRRFPCN
nr:MAG TPA: hypothetical protein [Caudoviricetes sp.]